MKTKFFTLIFVLASFFASNVLSQTVIFEESFTGGGNWAVIDQPTKWFNAFSEGGGRKWSTINQTSTSPVAFSYNRTAGADSWLVTAQPLNLTSSADSYVLEFSFGWGYYVSGEPFRFKVLVAETFDGANPLNSTWTDITDQLLTTVNVAGGGTAGLSETVKTPPSGGYPGTRLFSASLNAFTGKSIYIAFRDMLSPVKTDGTTYTSASMYVIDNIKISKSLLTSTVDIESNLNIWTEGKQLFIDASQETVVSIYNVSGKMIMNNQVVNKNFNLSLESGVYIVKTDKDFRKFIIM